MKEEINNLESLKSVIVEAFEKKPIDLEKIKNIGFELKLIPENKKYIYYEIVKEFLDRGFRSGYSEENLDLSDFEENQDSEVKVIEVKDDQHIEQKIESVIDEEKIESGKSLVSFKDLFDSLKSEMHSYFVNYKGYFVTQLINEFNLSYQLVFIYEDYNSTRTLQIKAKNLFGNVLFFKLEEEDLHLKLDQNSNYLCIFLLASKVNNLETLDHQIKKIEKFISYFNGGFEYHTLTNYYSRKDKKEIQITKSNNSKEIFIEDVKNFSSMFLSNIRLNFEEEKIIKKMCSRISNLIFYKILGGGFSGSKVIEIRPKKSYDQKKIYILKFGHLRDEKVKEERDNYDNYIPDGMFNKYKKPDYQCTFLYEGLMYDYAISPDANISYSFSDYFDKEKFSVLEVDKMNLIINDLFFKNELFDYWRKEYSEKKISKVSEIYNDYLLKEKITDSLDCLLDDEEKVNDFFVIFDKIWNFSLEYIETVCHGDLHTENFFIDDKNEIFLIDFGHTNKRHSLIDFVSLECSLKFKHFPFYLESEELKKIESTLLLPNTFNLNYNFSCTKRKDVLDFLSLINTIRGCSKQNFLNIDSNIEYYIALFVLTIRQIRYPNMNQRYAYHSAKKIGEYIINELKL